MNEYRNHTTRPFLRLGLPLAFAALALVVSARSAAAQATYEYLGNSFTQYSCGVNSTNTGTISCSTPAPTNLFTSYRATDHVTATLALDNPLPASLVYQDIRTFAGFSLTMHDGHQTVATPLTSGQAMFAEVSTDANGNILDWRFVINTGGTNNGGIATYTAPFGFVVDQGTLKCCDPSPGGDFARNSNIRGVWTLGGGAVNAPYGTAARAARHGELSTDTDILGGDAGVASITRYVASNDGSQAGRASIGSNCSPLPQWSKDCLRAGVWSGSFTGIARGIAFKTFRYTGSNDKTGRINAILDGEFRKAPFGLPNGYVEVGGAVRVFDAAGFSQKLAESGVPAGQFMLSGYSITAGTGTANLDQILTSTNSLFGASLLASGRNFLAIMSSPTETPLSIGIRTSNFVMQPGQLYTVMFDVASYSVAIRFADGTTGYGDANFLDTLSPDPALFFTDDQGNAITDIQAAGSTIPASPVLSSLAVTPASASGLLDTTQTFTATLLATGGVPVADALVHFEVTAGPNTGVIGIAPTDSAGHAAFAYTGTAGAGVDVVHASVGTLQSNDAQMLWNLPGNLDHIVLSPHSASIPVNTSQPFTVAAFDRFNALRGDVTASTTLSIAPDGSCSGASCTAPTTGDHTVTATYQGRTDSATVTFTAPTGYSFTGFFAPIDNLPIVNSSKAGSSVPVKFSLNGNQGLAIFAAGYPASQVTACSAGVVEAPVEQIAAAGASGLSYDAASDQYTYVWKTDKSWASQCRQLIVKLKDGSIHTVSFKFK